MNVLNLNLRLFSIVNWVRFVHIMNISINDFTVAYTNGFWLIIMKSVFCIFFQTIHILQTAMGFHWDEQLQESS